MNPFRQDLERYLIWIALALLLAGCVWVILPFVTALLWASVLSFCVWPIHRRLLARLGGRKTLAALLMALAMVCVVLLPFVVVGVSLADNVKELAAAVRAWVDAGPSMPGWVVKIPFVGEYLATQWAAFAADSRRLANAARPLLEPLGRGLLGAGMIVGRGIVELSLSILIAFFFLRDGKAIAERLCSTADRIAGERGGHLLNIAGNTVRGVVYGILGTALVQAVIAGIGFVIAGVPGALLLALLTFFLSIVPMGPPLIWIPAALWLFQQGQTGWGIFMIIWGLLVSSVDNVVKPWLISQGSDLGFLLIFFGVIGGALAFGFIGVFIGPTLLAVGHRLVQEWSASPATLEALAPPESQSEGKAS